MIITIIRTNTKGMHFVFKKVNLYALIVRVNITITNSLVCIKQKCIWYYETTCI